MMTCIGMRISHMEYGINHFVSARDGSRISMGWGPRPLSGKTTPIRVRIRSYRLADLENFLKVSKSESVS